MSYPKLAPSIENAEKISENPIADPAHAAASALPSLQGLDRSLHSAMASYTGGLAPAVLAGAFFDWYSHLLFSPGKRIELMREAAQSESENCALAPCRAGGADESPNLNPVKGDARFRAPQWNSAPFNLYAKYFLSVEKWWDAATTGVRGVSQQHEAMVRFVARQILDTMAPSNFLLANPQVLERTIATGGENLRRGFSNFLEDISRNLAGVTPAELEQFKVGETVAATPGKVIHTTRLAEIIQYAPTIAQVRPEPIVIVPAWIMKYYILDLSPENSLVKYLTEQGFTVFMISWKNPGKEDRDVGFDDYRTEGVLAAIEAATRITGCKKVHAVGYCLGGTLLAIAAAAMARDGDNRLASLSFLAAQTDFTEAGELKLFINESQIAFLEDMMWERGYLESSQMAGAFRLLRSNDLIWSRVVHDYLMGERSAPMDIMAWNADATRMPYRMHSEYLRALFLNNDLAEGRFIVNGRPITVHDIRTPVFAVSTEKDHVAPWRSVFKFHLLSEAYLTFVLTSGGHNAGILAPPAASDHHYRVSRHRQKDRYVDPDTWLRQNQTHEGSWWIAWTEWLVARSGAPIAPPPLGLKETEFAPLRDAPGAYVLVK
jgi:polyhydroxyalkanoate synthase